MSCSQRSTRHGLAILVSSSLFIFILIQVNLILVSGKPLDSHFQGLFGESDKEDASFSSEQSEEREKVPDPSLRFRFRSHPEESQTIRLKRSGISDQRLSELETLLALKRLRDQQLRSRVPVAYGVFDPDKIGKRRRRSNPFLDTMSLSPGSRGAYEEAEGLELPELFFL